MASETTLTPVAADISPTVIACVKERSPPWIAALTAGPDGFTLADINHRQRVAIAILQLSVDHERWSPLFLHVCELPRWDRSGSCAGRRAPHAPAAENVSQHLRGRHGRVNDTIESSPAVPQKTKART